METSSIDRVAMRVPQTVDDALDQFRRTVEMHRAQRVEGVFGSTFKANAELPGAVDRDERFATPIDKRAAIERALDKLAAVGFKFTSLERDRIIFPHDLAPVFDAFDVPEQEAA